MKVNITGYVQENRKRVEGIVDLPDKEAKRLIDLKVAEPVNKEDYPLISVNTETGEVFQVKDAENETLKAENEKLKTELKNTQDSIFKFEEQIKTLNVNIAENENLKAENESLKIRISELEGKIQQNSDSLTGETSSNEISEAEKEYRAMENKFLIELISQRGIELGKASKKDDYVALLLKHDAEPKGDE